MAHSIANPGFRCECVLGWARRQKIGTTKQPAIPSTQLPWLLAETHAAGWLSSERESCYSRCTSRHSGSRHMCTARSCDRLNQDWLPLALGADPVREELAKSGGELSLDAVRSLFPPTTGDAVFDPVLIRSGAERLVTTPAVDTGHPFLDQAVKTGLAFIDATFQGDHPKYGMKKYAENCHDGFPPTIIAAVDALSSWGLNRRATQLFRYYLVRLGRTRDFLLSLYGHVAYHQAQDHLTAYEQVSFRARKGESAILSAQPTGRRPGRTAPGGSRGTVNVPEFCRRGPPFPVEPALHGGQRPATLPVSAPPLTRMRIDSSLAPASSPLTRHPIRAASVCPPSAFPRAEPLPPLSLPPTGEKWRK